MIIKFHELLVHEEPKLVAGGSFKSNIAEIEAFDDGLDRNEGKQLMEWIGELIEETLMVRQKQKKIKKKHEAKGKMALKILRKDLFLKTSIYNAL